MRSALRAPAALLLAIVAAVGAGCGSQSEGAALLPDVEPLVRELAPSIVTVETVSLEGFESGGSGVVWSRDGLVVTAAHVVAGAALVVVRDARGRRMPARVVAWDPDLDLALLRVSRGGLVAASFASTLPAAGTLAVTVGRPSTPWALRWEGGWIERASESDHERGYDSFLRASSGARDGDSGGALAGEGPVVYGIVSEGSSDGPRARTYAVPAPVVRAFVERAA